MSFKRFIVFAYGRIKNIGRKTPYYANYDITAKCTQRCKHCYFYKTYKGRRELSDEEWEQMFERHYREGVRVVYLTGGEPFLRINVIRAADRIFPAVTIITNGTLPMPKDIKRRIFVSLDGPEEIHNELRGVNCFKKVLNNIQGDKRVVLTPCISTVNYRYVEDIVKIAKEVDVDGVMFSLYTSHQGEDDPLYLKGKQLDFVLKEFKRLMKKYGNFVFLTKKMIKTFKHKKHYKSCPMGKGNPKFVSYYPDLRVKRPCTLGEGVKCETCGCIAAIFPYLLKRFDIKLLFLLNRLYPKWLSHY